MASFAQVEDHPGAILGHLRPGAVLLVHWESFFRPRSRPLRSVPGTDVDEFLRRLKAALPPGTPWWMPRPGETVRIPVESGGPSRAGDPAPPSP